MHSLLVQIALVGMLHLEGTGVLSYIEAAEASQDVQRLIAERGLKKLGKKYHDKGDMAYGAGGLCLQVQSGTVSRLTFVNGEMHDENLCPPGHYTGVLPFGLQFGMTREATVAVLGPDSVAEASRGLWWAETGEIVELEFDSGGLGSVTVFGPRYVGLGFLKENPGVGLLFGGKALAAEPVAAKEVVEAPKASLTVPTSPARPVPPESHLRAIHLVAQESALFSGRPESQPPGIDWTQDVVAVADGERAVGALVP